MEMKVAKLVLDAHLLVTGAITCGDMCQGDWELLLVEAMFSETRLKGELQPLVQSQWISPIAGLVCSFP